MARRVCYPKKRSGARKSRFTHEQIIGLLKQVEAGGAVNKLGHKKVSDASFYKRRSRFGGMDVADVRRMRELEGKNGKLKRILAEAPLDIETPRVVARGRQ
jgi:putative transposase